MFFIIDLYRLYHAKLTKLWFSPRMLPFFSEKSFFSLTDRRSSQIETSGSRIETVGGFVRGDSTRLRQNA